MNDHQKLMEMEQTHRYNLETQMDELQLHTRKLNQQISDLTAKDKSSEKIIEDQKMQIVQLERVRYPLCTSSVQYNRDFLDFCY